MDLVIIKLKTLKTHLADAQENINAITLAQKTGATYNHAQLGLSDNALVVLTQLSFDSTYFTGKV